MVRIKLKQFICKACVMAFLAISVPVYTNVGTYEVAAAKTTTVKKTVAKLNKKSVTLKVGEKAVLKVSGIKGKVVWSSSNKKVATVTNQGKVTGVKAGKATITAKVNKKKFTCKVTVEKAYPFATKTFQADGMKFKYPKGYSVQDASVGNVTQYIVAPENVLNEVVASTYIIVKKVYAGQEVVAPEEQKNLFSMMVNEEILNTQMKASQGEEFSVKNFKTEDSKINGKWAFKSEFDVMQDDKLYEHMVCYDYFDGEYIVEIIYQGDDVKGYYKKEQVIAVVADSLEI